MKFHFSRRDKIDDFGFELEKNPICIQKSGKQVRVSKGGYKQFVELDTSGIIDQNWQVFSAT